MNELGISIGDGRLSNAEAAGLGVVGGLTVGSITGYAVSSARNRARKRFNSKRSKSKNSKSRTSRRARGRRSPRTAGKRKDRSTRRIRYTKNGQPYVTMRDGRTRFIKQKSAKRSHKQKGGRY